MNWDELWVETNEILRRINFELYPILELPNDARREELLKSIRARSVNVHYWRINLLRLRYNK